MTADTDAPAAEAAPAPEAKPARACENCGSPLYGDHCYACGQPTKGLVRHFSSILGDFFDTVLNIDSRVLRTLWPLLTRPGYLSLEYFAGRRVRYVTPMRLYLFLSIVAFFAMQASLRVDDDDGSSNLIQIGDSGNVDNLAKARTPAEVEAMVKQAHQRLAEARARMGHAPAVAKGLDEAEDTLRERAAEQIAWLKAVDAAKAAGRPPPPPPAAHGERKVFDFPVNGKPWDAKTNPLNFGWLPDAVNASINRRMGHAQQVLQSSNSEKPVVDAVFRVSPQVLFVLMPLFALMLKIAYLFKRRLYMEHLIVALHSHAFISLALTVILALSALQGWLVPNAGFFNGLLGWGRGLMIAWIPFYLLLMQKRVYGQGWPMTLIKYGVLGLSYTVLLSIGLVVAVLVGLLTL